MSVEEDPLAKENIREVPLLTTIWVFFGFTVILLTGRLGIRLRLHHRLFWDDIFAILGTVFLLVQNILTIYILPIVYMLARYLAGKLSRPDDFDDQIATMLKLSLIINVMFASSIYAVKASFLALMWRLVKNLALFRRIWWAITITIGITYAVTVALEPIACAKLYNNGCVSQSDVDRNLVTLRVGTIIDVGTDLLIMALPVAFTLKSQLPRGQKLGLIGLFLLGFCIIAMAIVRIISLDNEDRHPSLTWKVFWGSMESAVAVMTSCCASFKTLFTVRTRPSAYPYGAPGTYPSNNLRSHNLESHNAPDFQFPLVERSVMKDRKFGGKNSTTVTTADKGWSETGSREEILHKTDFEVKYDHR